MKALLLRLIKACGLITACALPLIAYVEWNWPDSAIEIPDFQIIHIPNLEPNDWDWYFTRPTFLIITGTNVNLGKLYFYSNYFYPTIAAIHVRRGTNSVRLNIKSIHVDGQAISP